MVSFKNQIVLISGASRGIGAAAAISFARGGAKAVAINYLNHLDSARLVAREVEAAGSKALLLKGDVSDRDQARALVDHTVETLGDLDIVVANAGVWPAAEKSILQLDDEQFENTIRINVHGVFWICRVRRNISRVQRREPSLLSARPRASEVKPSTLITRPQKAPSSASQNRSQASSAHWAFVSTVLRPAG